MQWYKTGFKMSHSVRMIPSPAQAITRHIQPGLVTGHNQPLVNHILLNNSNIETFHILRFARPFCEKPQRSPA